MASASKLFYFGVRLRKHKLGFLARIVDWTLRYFYSCEVHTRMNIGGGMLLLHNGLGVVIHPGATIGNNLKIHQNCTIGGNHGYGLPIIGDNVMIGAGAVIMGEIRIGNNVKIGANAVVLTDVPDNCTAVGVPAKIIKAQNKW